MKLIVLQMMNAIMDQYAHTSVWPFWDEDMRELNPLFRAAFTFAFASSRWRVTCS